jgi:hypothetical protein
VPHLKLQKYEFLNSLFLTISQQTYLGEISADRQQEKYILTELNM